MAIKYWLVGTKEALRRSRINIPKDSKYYVDDESIWGISTYFYKRLRRLLPERMKRTNIFKSKGFIIPSFLLTKQARKYFNIKE